MVYFYILLYMSEQKLLQIHRQISELAQKQDNCNSVLGLMLSSAESFSNRFGINKNPKLFESYNLYHSGDLKNEYDLKSQLTIHIKIFRNLVNHEKMKGRKYTFPENLGPQDVKKLVIMWKNNVKKEDQIYYDNIISILDENFDINFPSNQNKVSYHKSPQGIDPNQFLNIVPNVMGCIDHRSVQVGLEAQKTGVINNKIMMGSTESFNPQLNKLQFSSINKGLDKNEEDKKKVINSLDKTFVFCECYYYLFCKKYNIYVGSNPKYGEKSQYFQHSIEELESMASNYINEFKNLLGKYGHYCEDNINDYYNSACKWYSNTKAELFLVLKSIIEDYYQGVC